MRIILAITFLHLSIFGFSQQNKKNNVDSLKLELAKFLVEKNQLKNLEEFTEKNRGLYFKGIYKNELDDELKKGVYVFSNGSNHHYIFYVLIDENSFKILDISTFHGLKESINQFLFFADKQNYCEQIINDYLSRFLNVHYNINRNPRNRINRNCEYESRSIKSTFDINSLKIKLAEFLVDKKELKNMEFFFNYPEFLLVEKFDIYYGIKENEKMDCGLYSFEFLNIDSSVKYYFVMLNEDWTEIFDIDNVENLLNGIDKILNFAENHNYCHLRTLQLIEQLIQRKEIESCLENSTFELP